MKSALVALLLCPALPALAEYYEGQVEPAPACMLERAVFATRGEATACATEATAWKDRIKSWAGLSGVDGRSSADFHKRVEAAEIVIYDADRAFRARLPSTPWSTLSVGFDQDGDATCGRPMSTSGAAIDQAKAPRPQASC